MADEDYLSQTLKPSKMCAHLFDCEKSLVVHWKLDADGFDFLIKF